MTQSRLFVVGCGLTMLASLLDSSWLFALDGGALRVNPRNGWSAFEVISRHDNPTNDGYNWAMPGTFDGLGALLSDPSAGPPTLRVQVNHENSDATISEVNLDLASFETAISNMISSGHTGGGRFVNSARQAYDRWSSDGGATWTDTSDPSNTNFSRYCSGQSYVPNTFGIGRGFVDNVYVTGEEGGSNRLFAIDSDNRDLYQLSGVVGSANGGLGGLPFDAWENAALLDTGETQHVALLLSPDGGSARMQLYIGEKGKSVSGIGSNDFLARNGLAFGSYYYLNDVLPSSLGETSTDGTVDTTASGALISSKLEDVDTSPGNPTRAVLGDQDSGVFTFDFNLDFTSGSFDADGSNFSIKKIHAHNDATNGLVGDADNVDWTAPTVLNGSDYPEGLIFVNEDYTTGEIWMSAPDGSGATLIGDTGTTSGATESSGILDISELVGYQPGSILLTSNQGVNASLTVLINPAATPTIADADFDGDGDIDGVDFLRWQQNVGAGTMHSQGDAERDGDVDDLDLAIWKSQFGGSAPTSAAAAVPEPSSMGLMAIAVILLSRFCSLVPVAEHSPRLHRVATDE